MRNGWQVGVVIPARNEEHFIADVISSVPDFVDHVVVVNDGSKDKTGEIVKNHMAENDSIELINLSGNGGGCAIDSGHRRLLERLNEPFVSVVMAGDGQMDPLDLSSLIEPVTNNTTDYVKGNRFHHLEGTGKMPKVRKLASIILGFFTTLAAGRHVSDPQCGYTATSSRVLKEWNWSKSWKYYGYPNYWLIELSRRSFSIKEIPVRSVYGDEKSGIKMIHFFITVSLMMLLMHHRRCFSMLISRSVAPHTILAFIAYIIGWIAIIPGLSTDLEDEITNTRFSKFVLLLACWTCAHILDRLAVESRTELRKNAQA